MNQPLNLSTSQPLNLSTSQPLNLSTSQPLNLSTSQPLNLSTSQPLPTTHSSSPGSLCVISTRAVHGVFLSAGQLCAKPVHPISMRCVCHVSVDLGALMADMSNMHVWQIYRIHVSEAKVGSYGMTIHRRFSEFRTLFEQVGARTIAH
jgi:hypothetical protein